MLLDAIDHTDLSGAIKTWLLGSNGLIYALTAMVAFSVARIIYNIHFHPLSKFPGPLWNVAFEFPTSYIRNIQGRFLDQVKSWHDQYGPIVRIAPNALSVDGEIGWPQIYGYRSSEGEADYEKLPSSFGSSDLDIVFAKRDVHRRERRALGHGFSDSALAKHEDILQQHFSSLMNLLSQMHKDGETINIVDLITLTTFDIVGELAFSDSFHGLENRNNKPMVHSFFDGVRSISVQRFLQAYPLLNLFVRYMPIGLDVRAMDKVIRQIHEKAKDRMAFGHEKAEGQADFMTHMLKPKRDGTSGLSAEEILQSSNTIIIGGSDTVATAVSGFCYYAAQNPRVYKTLAEEVRSAFSSEEDIGNSSTAPLQYLVACINETLRIYPPVAVPVERISPGAEIQGRFIPAGSVLTVSQWATFRNRKHWREPDRFIPERWLPSSHSLYDERFKDDNRGVFKPFAFGPRDCVGKNLAAIEMRILICRLLWRFDFELLPGQEDWSKQLNFLIWDKGPLNLKLKPRNVA